MFPPDFSMFSRIFSVFCAFFSVFSVFQAIYFGFSRNIFGFFCFCDFFGFSVFSAEKKIFFSVFDRKKKFRKNGNFSRMETAEGSSGVYKAPGEDRLTCNN